MYDAQVWLISRDAEVCKQEKHLDIKWFYMEAIEFPFSTKKKKKTSNSFSQRQQPIRKGEALAV